MNEQQVKEIIDTIKTLNINVNDETTQKLVDVLEPLFRMFIIRSYVQMVVSIVIVSIICYMFYKIVVEIMKYKTANIKKQDDC